jgi:uncharacterized protein YcfJ
MNCKTKSALGVSALVLSAHAAAQITFYEGEAFRGRSFSTDQAVRNFDRSGFNDRASSVVVDRGRWEVCEDVRFEGRCVVLRRGSYDSLRGMGLDNRISSVRPVEGRSGYSRYEPEPIAAPTYEYRRRPHERVYEAPITSVRAVMGPPEQRCWVERERVAEPRVDAGGALAGAIIGGVIGHQLGNGRNRDAATAGGALAGAAIGAHAGSGTVVHERDVQRCTQSVSGTPQYYDVTYNFRGMEHRAQLTTPPGRTITVNQDGVPRG